MPDVLTIALGVVGLAVLGLAACALGAAILAGRHAETERRLGGGPTGGDRDA